MSPNLSKELHSTDRNSVDIPDESLSQSCTTPDISFIDSRESNRLDKKSLNNITLEGYEIIEDKTISDKSFTNETVEENCETDDENNYKYSSEEEHENDVKQTEDITKKWHDEEEEMWDDDSDDYWDPSVRDLTWRIPLSGFSDYKPYTVASNAPLPVCEGQFDDDVDDNIS